jgi:hypothetical protein
MKIIHHDSEQSDFIENVFFYSFYHFFVSEPKKSEIICAIPKIFL